MRFNRLSYIHANFQLLSRFFSFLGSGEVFMADLI